MEQYDFIDILPTTTQCYDHRIGGWGPLDLSALAAASQAENMKPMTAADMLGYPIGMLAVGTSSQPLYFEQNEALAHAAITRFEFFKGALLAEVGGVVALEPIRRQGWATRVVDATIQVASLDKNIKNFGHDGFIAKCNPKSHPVFAALGFTATKAPGSDKIIMVKYL